MDDIVVGAHSREEAFAIVRRLQSRVEELSLYLNTGKTKIVRCADFRAGLMKAANDEVGELAAAMKLGAVVASPRLEEVIERHMALTKRPEAWSRVLRRLYTVARDARCERFLDCVDVHLADFPDSARNIFDYLTAFPLESELVDRLSAAVDGFSGVYEDVEILFALYLSVAPNADCPDLRVQVVQRALRVIEDRRVATPRVAAANVLVLSKFGSRSDVLALEHLYLQRRLLTVDLEHAMVAVLGLEPESKNHGYWDAMAKRSRFGGYLTALQAGERQAVSMALSATRPILRRPPARAVFSPRMLLLAPVVRRAAAKQVAGRSRAWVKTVEGTPRPLRDLAALRLLTDGRP
jgi:hypothetical protein